MVTAQILDRLVAANINLLPLTQIENHWVFERDGFVALVERTRENGLGRIGSAGLLTLSGMAALTTRNGRSVFVAKGFEQEAAPAQIAALRRFSDDLAAALAADQAPS